MQNENNLLKIGFSKEELNDIPKDLKYVIETLYSEIELQFLSKQKLLQGALLLQKIFFPKTTPTSKKWVQETLHEKNSQPHHPIEIPHNKYAPQTLAPFFTSISPSQALFIINNLLEKQTIDPDFAHQQQNLFQNAQNERSKRFAYFEAYLKKGKTDIELLHAKLFANFYNEIIQFINSYDKSIPANQWLLKKKNFFRKEKDFIQEKLLLRMTFCLSTQTELKNALKQSYLHWEAISTEKKQSAALQKLEEKYLHTIK